MKTMDEIGVGWKTSGDKLLVRLQRLTDKRAVFDQGGNKVGDLLDVIGPVKSPTGVVSSRDKDLIGKKLFVQ